MNILLACDTYFQNCFPNGNNQRTMPLETHECARYSIPLALCIGIKKFPLVDLVGKALYVI